MPGFAANVERAGRMKFAEKQKDDTQMSTQESSQDIAPFTNDSLERRSYADFLARMIVRVASTKSLPAGRVLAVDAPWGSGKTWIATQLPAYLGQDREIGKCIYVNAFEFDYHHDPFVVLASAMLDACRGQNQARAEFKQAAAGVLKAVLPAIGKAAIRVGTRSLGLDGVVDEVSDALGDGANASIEDLLSSFEKQKASVVTFHRKLAELAADANGPLVVLIDELDRCRPSFALETLERVKHLFDVPGVVFVLFVHGPALHSAIRRTYGQEIDPSAYLRKFISLTLSMPRTLNGRIGMEHEPELISVFLSSSSEPDAFKSQNMQLFRDAICDLAPLFVASLRDVQTAILIGSVRDRSRELDYPHEAAYSILLHLLDREQAQRLRDPATQKEGYRREAERLAPLATQIGLISHFRTGFSESATGVEEAKGYGTPQERLASVSRVVAGLSDTNLAYLRR